jgi:SAM-dependent methyltransferase
MYAPDPEHAIAEMHRVLRPGCRAACAVWGERRKCGWADIFPIVDARVQSEVCPMFFRLGMGEAFQRAFQSAGFGAIASGASRRFFTIRLLRKPAKRRS